MTYRTLRRLSGGGFSDVFAVEDLASALPERLVLKRLNAEMSARPEVREAFSSEAKILRELRHANIVTFRRCYYDDEGRVCLLMEEVAGEPLDVWAEHNSGDPELVLDVFAEVLGAVSHLHRRPLPYLHLDLKPDNIVVATSGGRARPVLIDFGIARRSGGTGLRAYTPPYAAPEQQSGSKLGPATDVHALGHVLAELLARVELPADVAAGLAQVAERARNPSRSTRYADASEMGLAFRLARRAESGAVSSRSSGSLPLWVWAAGAAAAVLLATAALVALRSPQPAAAGGEEAATPPAVQEAESPEVASADRIQELLDEARRAALDEQFDNADRSYVQAKRLADSMAQDEEAKRQVAKALETVRQQIEFARQGTWVEDRSRLDLQETSGP